MNNRDYQIISKILRKAIAGMRDITAHKYQTLKMGDVWITLEDDIPKLKTLLNEVLK